MSVALYQFFLILFLGNLQTQDQKQLQIENAIKDLSSTDENNRTLATRKLISLEAENSVEGLKTKPEFKDYANKILNTISLFKIVPRLKSEWAKAPWDIEELANAKKKDWPYLVGYELRFNPDFLTCEEQKLLTNELLKDSSVKKRIRRIGLNLEQPKLEEAWFYFEIVETESTSYSGPFYPKKSQLVYDSSYAIDVIANIYEDKSLNVLISFYFKRIEEKLKSNKSYVYIPYFGDKTEKIILKHCISNLEDNSKSNYTTLYIIKSLTDTLKSNFDELTLELVAKILIKRYYSYDKEGQKLALRVLEKIINEIDGTTFEDAIRLFSTVLDHNDFGISSNSRIALLLTIDRLEGTLLKDCARLVLSKFENSTYFSSDYISLIEKISERVDGQLAKEIAEVLLTKANDSFIISSSAKALGNISPFLDSKLTERSITTVESTLEKEKGKLEKARLKFTLKKLKKRNKELKGEVSFSLLKIKPLA